MNRTALTLSTCLSSGILLVAASFYLGRVTAPVRTLPPVLITSPATAASAPAAGQAGQLVWVNVKSGIYHKPGDRWYGATKDGAYMDESAARAQGYRAAIVY